MIETTNDRPVPVIRKMWNAAIIREIDETLNTMADGASFLIAGKIRKNTVLRCAKVAGMKVKIALDDTGALRCWKIGTKQ